ncbi:uncharacterized protein LOC105219080 [Zeugodacus cucurbitae]|uniref:uncharacterized protein LOC105219080 n=1 Tax=Zeugodacus cucurbitae TaxID=28588 RepID=UPI000596A9E2|nr:uncharacterized protein LOC105219080 [Zeugodacus cucurbitae]
MAINKYYVVFLLLIGLTCTHADDIEISEQYMEMFSSRNELLNSIFNESIELLEFISVKGDELCQKIVDADVYKNVTSEVLESRDKVLSNCIHHVMDRLDPTKSRLGDGLDETVLLKYGFENIRKVVDQKYEGFYVEIVRRIDEYVKGLTVEQQKKQTAQNLKMWSSKIKNAPTLAAKEMTYRRCMRYYYFENGV